MKKKVSKEAKKEQTPKLGEGKAKTPRKNKEERQGMLLDDLIVAENCHAAETTNDASPAAATTTTVAAAKQTGRLPGMCAGGDERTGETFPEAISDNVVAVETPIDSAINGDTMDTSVEYLVEASAAEAETISAAIAAAKARKINGDVEQIQDSDDGVKAVPTGKQNSTLIMPESAMLSSIPHGVRLHHRAVVVAAETGSALDCMVRQLSIDQFENEGSRVCCGTAENATAARKLFDRKMSINTVPKKVIAQLLKPRGWKPPVCRQFFLDCNEIGDLCDTAEHIFSNEPSVLVVKAPVKIFGDLHGQFGDLMRLFDEYGSPSTAGDIA
uniref:Serine/threonine-protein phosphatase BSL3 n=1 Tax=Vitis vinifera TaxID=29760 RepID=A5BRM3_VITVI|nr:hypothetical protein VITISV_016224 [Vitis vinifera]